MLRRLLRHLQHIVTALVLLAVSLVGLELWLQWMRPVAPPVIASQADSASQAWLIPSATVHHRMRPLAEFSCANDSVVIRTNSLGLRGPEPAGSRTADSWRVVLLGDDCVSGTWLEEEFTLSARLKAYLRKHIPENVEVINAGVPGYSPLLSLIQYSHDLMRLEPDLVILHFDMSDVADDADHRCFLHDEGSQPICLHPLLASSIDPQHPALSLLRNSAVVDLVRRQLLNDSGTDFQSRYAWTQQTHENVEGRIRHAMDSVAKLVQQTRMAGQPLLLTTAPVRGQVVAGDGDQSLSRDSGLTDVPRPADDFPFRVLFAWSSEAGIPFLNVTHAFRQFESPERLFQSGTERLSKYGMALYARELARKILRMPAMAQAEGNRRE